MNLHTITSLASHNHAKLLRNATLLAIGMSALIFSGCTQVRTYNPNKKQKSHPIKYSPASTMRAEHTNLKTALGHKDFVSPRLMDLFAGRDNISDSNDYNRSDTKTELRLGKKYVLGRPSANTNGDRSFSAISPDLNDMYRITYQISLHTLSFNISPNLSPNASHNFVRYVSYDLHSVAKAKNRNYLKFKLYPTKFRLKNKTLHRLPKNKQKEYPIVITTKSGNHDYSSKLKPGYILPKEN